MLSSTSGGLISELLSILIPNLSVARPCPYQFDDCQQHWREENREENQVERHRAISIVVTYGIFQGNGISQ